MRELTIQEMEEVGGGYGIDDAVDLANTGGLIGSLVGYTVTGTLAGASRGGLWGAGIGFSWGLGYGFGSWAYDTFLDGYY